MYVVIGATGNTGSAVAERLLARGQKVCAIGRSAERLKSLKAKGAEPFICDISDATALEKALTGAKAAYLMIPPDVKTQHFRAYQERVMRSIIEAVKRSRINQVVVLSSIGADKPEKTGPVVSLHHFERRLKEIETLNALFVRAGYFMENTLAQLGIIKSLGMCAGPLRPDLKLPMIATRDIGNYVAEALLKLDFEQRETRELLGQRDLDMNEVATILGKAIGNPDLQYRQLSDDKVRASMIQMGMSEEMSDLILEMSVSLNSGYMRALEQRAAKNTTPTSYETFVTEELAPRFKEPKAA